MLDQNGMAPTNTNRLHFTARASSHHTRCAHLVATQTTQAMPVPVCGTPEINWKLFRLSSIFYIYTCVDSFWRFKRQSSNFSSRFDFRLSTCGEVERKTKTGI